MLPNTYASQGPQEPPQSKQSTNNIEELFNSFKATMIQAIDDKFNLLSERIAENASKIDYIFNMILS